MYVVHSSSSSSSNKRRSFFFFFSSFHTTNCQGTEYGVPGCVIPKLTPQNCATPYRGRPFPPSAVTSAKRWGREQVKTLVFGSCKMCACATPCTLQALDRFVLALPVCSLFSLSLFFFHFFFIMQEANGLLHPGNDMHMEEEPRKCTNSDPRCEGGCLDPTNVTYISTTILPYPNTEGGVKRLREKKNKTGLSSVGARRERREPHRYGNRAEYDPACACTSCDKMTNFRFFSPFLN